MRLIGWFYFLVPHDVNVIPDAVDRESITVAQVTDLLNISWAPVTNVNHGKVSYEIRVHCDDESDTKVHQIELN